MFPDFRHTFPLTEEVTNIEFGAGRGCFGKIEFPQCFLTDLMDNGLQHATDIDNPEVEDCHYLDGIADYYTFNFDGRKFRNLVFCNPFGFGFNGKYETIRFLNRALELLNENGEIYILGQNGNGWVKKNKAVKWVSNYNETNDCNWSINKELTTCELEELNARHNFRKTTGDGIYVNVGYTLKNN